MAEWGADVLAGEMPPAAGGEGTAAPWLPRFAEGEAASEAGEDPAVGETPAVGEAPAAYEAPAGDVPAEDVADEVTGASPGTAQACSDLGLNSLQSNLERFGIKPPGVS